MQGQPELIFLGGGGGGGSTVVLKLNVVLYRVKVQYLLTAIIV